MTTFTSYFTFLMDQAVKLMCWIFLEFSITTGEETHFVPIAKILKLNMVYSAELASGRLE